MRSLKQRYVLIIKTLNHLFHRQPKHLKIQLTGAAAAHNLLSKFSSFGQQLVHLEIGSQYLAGHFLTDLIWLQGRHLLCLFIQCVASVEQCSPLAVPHYLPCSLIEYTSVVSCSNGHCYHVCPLQVLVV